MLKTCTALIVAIFERFCCFDEVFLMALTSTEQLFIERPLYSRRFLHRFSCIMITYSISSSLCKKSYLQCYRFYNFPFFTSSHWRRLLEKRLLEISQNSQENTCGRVSFLIKLQTEAAPSDLSCVFSWRFLVYFTSTEKWDDKREIPWWSSNIYFFARVSVFLTSKISKEIWQMVIWSENVFKENLLLQFSWLEEISA